MRNITSNVNAETLFRRAITNVNIITPTVKKYGKAGKYVYELSEGEFSKKKIYGVTVVEIDGNRATHIHSKSRCFIRLISATRYIQSLKNDTPKQKEKNDRIRRRP